MHYSKYTSVGNERRQGITLCYSARVIGRNPTKQLD